MVDTPAKEQRTTGAENVIWDLSIFYQGIDDPAIQSDLDKVQHMADAFVEKYKGRIADLSPSEMLQMHKDGEVIQDLMGRIYSFVALSYSTDSADPTIGAMMGKVMENYSMLSQKVVFAELEWNALDDADAQKFLDAPELAKYRFHMEADRRYKPFQLSEVEEQILMDKSVTGNNAWTRFFTQLVSAMRFDWEGEKINMPTLLEKVRNEDRDVRRKAADILTEGLKEKSMEFTYIFNVLAADKASDDRRRGYETWISSRNLSNLAPDEVVDALVNTVTSNYDLVSAHYNLKRVLLGVDELTDYDRYAPIPIKESEKFYTWDEAKDIVLNAFAAFSPRMAEVAQMFFDNNWIHAPVLDNKRGGAFASPSVPSAHPFVFVNFLGTANNVATLAHELGHGIHMYLSGEAHGFQGLYTPLTTAEMASVFAEMVVFQDLMSREEDPEVRLSMLAGKVEDSFATVFRQTAMNRFEDGLHNARRTEGELSTERVSEIWMETQKAMFGDSVNLRDEYGIWWAYIPHFLNTPGYVYAYAFGELLVMALYKLYEENGESFVPQYIDVLAAGGSDYPDKILDMVGVDLNDPKFWEKGIAALRELVEEETKLAHELYPEKFN